MITKLKIENDRSSLLTESVNALQFAALQHFEPLFVFSTFSAVTTFFTHAFYVRYQCYIPGGVLKEFLGGDVLLGPWNS